MKPIQNTGETERTYTIENLGDVPSVTTVTKQVSKGGALIGWACKVMGQYILENKDEFIKNPEEVITKAKGEHKRISSEAMDFGSSAHNRVEVYLKGQKVDGLLQNDPRLAQVISAFQKWEKEHDFKLTLSEHIVYSKKYRFAGTLDIVGTIKGVPYIVDLKTSSGIYPDYFMQVVAYKKAYEEMTGEEIKGVGILRIFKGKEVGCEWKDFTDEKMIGLEWVKFCNLLNYWWVDKELEQKEKDGTQSSK